MKTAVENEMDLSKPSKKFSEGEFCKKDSESGEAAVKNEKDLYKPSKELSEGEYYKKVKELESVEAADENHEEDLSQSSKEPSEG